MKLNVNKIKYTAALIDIAIAIDNANKRADIRIKGSEVAKGIQIIKDEVQRIFKNELREVEPNDPYDISDMD